MNSSEIINFDDEKYLLENKVTLAMKLMTTELLEISHPQRYLISNSNDNIMVIFKCLVLYTLFVI